MHTLSRIFGELLSPFLWIIILFVVSLFLKNLVWKKRLWIGNSFPPLFGPLLRLYLSAGGNWRLPPRWQKGRGSGTGGDGLVTGITGRIRFNGADRLFRRWSFTKREL